MLKYFMVYNLFRKNMDKTVLVIVAIVVAFGLLGVIVIESIVMPAQQAEARGCNNSIAVNASKGRCIRG
jgi:hypothetical protein